MKKKIYRLLNLKWRVKYLFYRYVKYRKASCFLYVCNYSKQAGLSLTHGFSWKRPLSSLQKALEVAAPHGVIFVSPGHQEVIPSEPLDITTDFLSIIGLGSGRNRPSFISAEAQNEKEDL